MSSTDGTVALQAVPDHQLEKWLAGHHVAVTHTRDGKKYHAFVYGGYPLVGPEPRAVYDLNIDIPLGPITLKLRGSVNTSTLAANISLYIGVPFLPDIKVAELSGNLRDGITFTIGVSGIVSGSVTIYISDDDWLHVKFTLTVFGENYSADLPLFPIPWL